MPETQIPSPQDSEAAKKAPITLAEVLQACKELDQDGIPLTRRAVREKLGRGSMTTIHNGVTEYESQKAPVLPSIALTEEDQQLIASFIAQALAVTEGRVQAILKDREELLLQRIEAEKKRAEDAILAADHAVEVSQQHAKAAHAARTEAEQQRDQALQTAQAAKEECLMIQGKLEQLSAEKADLAARLLQVEAEAALLQTRIEVETVHRQKAEAATLSALNDLASLRRDLAAKAEDVQGIQQALAAEQSRSAELKGAYGALTQALQAEQQQRDSLLKDFAELRSTLAAEQTLSATLRAEKDHLHATLAAHNEQKQQAETVASLQGIAQALTDLLRQSEHKAQET